MTGHVAFTFDNMGAARDVGLGLGVKPEPSAPEATIGYPWLLDVLDRTAIPASFFIEGWSGIHHRDRVEALVEAGHDVGLHGWVHERWDRIDDHEAQRLIHDGTAALRACGAESTIFRAPGGTTTTATRAALSDLGYTIDASLDDDVPATPGIASVPFEWPLVDAYHYLDKPDDDLESIRHMEQTWTTRFHAAAANGERLVVIAHAFLSGVSPERRAAFERLVEAVLTNPDLEAVSLHRAATARP